MRRPVLAAAVLAALLPLSACARTVDGRGSAASPGGARPAAASAAPSIVQNGDDLVARARNSFHAVFRGVHLTGTAHRGGVAFTVTADVGSDWQTGQDSGTATIVVDGVPIAVRHLGSDTWLQAPAPFWSGLVPAGDPRPTGTSWVVLHAATVFPASYANWEGTLALVLPAPRATLTVTGSTTVTGRYAARVTDADHGEYDLVSDDGIVVPAHVEHGSDSYDIAVTTTAPAVTAPAPGDVMTVRGL